MTPIAIPGFSEPFSSLSHLLAALGFFIASFVLLHIGRGNNNRIVGLSIYCFSLVFLFSMSGVYHLLQKGETANYVLQILDYSAIFTLIAGTITPIHIILFRGLNRWLVLFTVWTLAITGLTLNAVFFQEIPEWVTLSCFLGLGWFGLFTIWSIYKVHNRKLIWYVVVGGLFYSIGAVCEFLRWPIVLSGVIGPHEVFHVFVILGALTHWRLVRKIATYPLSSKITFIVKEYPNGYCVAQATSEHKIIEADSRESLKKIAREWIQHNFHADMKPDEVYFEFKSVDKLKLRHS